MLDISTTEVWFVEKLVCHQELIRNAYLFGSILWSFQHLSDVDLVLIFNRWEVRDTCTQLRKEFFEKFKIPLHVQIFHHSQINEFERFLIRAEPTRKII